MLNAVQTAGLQRNVRSAVVKIVKSISSISSRSIQRKKKHPEGGGDGGMEGEAVPKEMKRVNK
jgi:hypothetical protein